MAKRKKGWIPYESEHPTRPWMPDVPGHQQRSPKITNRQKELLKEQIDKLRAEIIPEKPSGEKLG